MVVKRSPLLLVPDITTGFLCLFFAVCEFSLIGKRCVKIGDYAFDHGAWMGIIFFASAVALPFLITLMEKSRNILVGWVRMFYPMAFFGLFFQQCILVTNIIYSGKSFDAFFVDVDQWIFGFQPAVEFWRALPQSPILNELLFLSYFFFYFLMAGTCWIAYFRKDRNFAVDAFAIISTAFYLLYIFYIFFPVKGPKYFIPELKQTWYGHFEGYIFTEIMKIVFNNVTLSGAAFPSSHAAISVLSLMLTFRYSRRLGLAFTPLVLLLLISTVYIYAHYAIDTIAGATLGAIFYFWLPQVVRRLGSVAKNVEALFQKWIA